MPSDISDYALIGDCETAALVSRNGSIDWLCWPRFDSGACFAGLLGSSDHGSWTMAPRGGNVCIERSYRGDTLILETRFATDGGSAKIIDFMPLRRDHNYSDLVRIVVGESGSVDMQSDLRIRFDYGRIIPSLTRLDDGSGYRAIAGQHSVVLRTPANIRSNEKCISSQFTVNEGESISFTLAYDASHLPIPEPRDPEHALRETDTYWREWIAQCTYDGEWPEAVKRSLITVKAMTYRPTGGLVAAVTTSLPELIGGERNWDYRYCWLRDSHLMLLAMMNAGYGGEAEAWCAWLLRAVAGSASQIQPLYGIAGEHRCDEVEVDSLPGYRDSAPVRIGNAAYKQLQVDVIGSVLDTFYEARTLGLELDDAWADLQVGLLRHLEDVWQHPDQGIWEVRGEARHFTHSKVMAWVAFDRAIKSVEQFGLHGPIDHWKSVRKAIHSDVCAQGYNHEIGAFVQSYGSAALDASTLLIPVLGFLPPDDLRVVATVQAVEKGLTRDGLLMRYDTDEASDGLDGDEGAFLACSFWLVDAMILQGRRKQARELFERLLSLSNDLGLLSEQFDWRTGKQVGNFPQAFSHFALVDTATNFAGGQGLVRESGKTEK